MKYLPLWKEDIAGDYHLEVLDPTEPLYRLTQQECDHQNWLVIEMWDKDMTKMISRKLSRCQDCGYSLKTPLEL